MYGCSNGAPRGRPVGWGRRVKWGTPQGRRVYRAAGAGLIVGEVGGQGAAAAAVKASASSPSLLAGQANHVTFSLICNHSSVKVNVNLY